MTPPIIIDSGPSERGWSFYSKFLRCPQLFFWKHIYADAHRLGWNDATAPLTRGTLVHVGLAHYYAQQWARENGFDPSKILAPLDAVARKAEQMGDLGAEMRPVAEAMLGSYWRRYPVESFHVVAVEEPMEIMFGDARYTARLDLVVEERGKVYIYDTKTTARMEAKTFPKYTLHGQFFGAWYLGRQRWGDKFGGIVINAVSEDGECLRRPQEPAPFMLRKFPLIIKRAAGDIGRMTNLYGSDQDAWEARPDEQICFGPYGRCSAFELCRWGHSTKG